MNRQEFMNRLEYLLRGIPASEREDALAYYNDYFDEAGAENEAQVIMELGSPEIVAEKILADVQQDSYRNSTDNEKKKLGKTNKILTLVILVLTFPIWFGVGVGLVGAVFGIVVGFIGAAFGLAVGGGACMIGGILCLMTAPVDGLVSIAVGALLAAIGVLLAIPCMWLIGDVIPKSLRAIKRWIKGLLGHSKGGNEI